MLTNQHLAVPAWVPSSIFLLSVHLRTCVWAYVRTILHMCVGPPSSCAFPSSVFWVKKGRGGCGLSIKWEKNRTQASGSVLSLNWSSLSSRRCTMCAHVLQYVSPVRPPPAPSFLLIGSFSPLINSVSAGWPEPSYDKHSTIDQYLKQLTYPSVYEATDVSAAKRGGGVLISVRPLCC